MHPHDRAPLAADAPPPGRWLQEGEARLLGRLLLASLAFLALLVLAQVSLTEYQFEWRLGSALVEGLRPPPAVVLAEWVGAAAGLLVAHCAWALTLWSLIVLHARAFAIDPARLPGLGLLGFLLATAWLLLYHAAAHPDSTFSKGPVGQAAASWPGLVTVASALMAAFVVSGVALLLWCSALPILRRHPRGPAALVIAAAIGIGALAVPRGTSGTASARPAPDVILIGVDSLRPDFVGLTTPRASGPSSAIAELLASSVTFEEAITPLARTFPAWLSVLTGRDPVAHGGRYNLMPPELVEREETLPRWLHRAGYQTLLATDERRFSNLDQEYGFDRVIGPPAGANDFVLATLLDLPPVNLLSATRAGRWLFPYSYANRAAHVAYRPEVFDRWLARAIEGSDDRPLFLAVHFCLGHWPFTWAGSGLEVPDHLHQLPASQRRYAQALERADRQVGTLLGTLDRAGRLDNALVVLFSDHGTAFPEDVPWRNADALWPAPGPARGHGTDVMEPLQHRVVLGFHGRGAWQLEPARRPGRVSLIDVAPTVVDLLGLPSPGPPFDGTALTPRAKGHDAEGPGSRPLFVETGFTPRALLAAGLDVGAVMHEGAGFYELRASGKLTLRKERLGELLESKQHAVLWGRWILSLRREPSGDRVLELGDLGTRWWWPEPIMDRSGAPVAALTAALCAHLARGSEPLPSSCAPATEPTGPVPATSSGP